MNLTQPQQRTTAEGLTALFVCDAEDSLFHLSPTKESAKTQDYDQ